MILNFVYNALHCGVDVCQGEGREEEVTARERRSRRRKRGGGLPSVSGILSEGEKGDARG